MSEKIIEIVDKIDASKVFNELSHPKSGGICVFVGTVREFTKGEEVVSLEFETYKKMALKEMDKIATEAFVKWNLNKVIIRHAVGLKEELKTNLSETSSLYYQTVKANETNNTAIKNVQISQVLDQFYELKISISTYGEVENDVPIFCPAFTDSSAGFGLVLHQHNNPDLAEDI